MKKLILLGLAVIAMTACQQEKQYFTDSSEIDEIRTMIADYHAGDWDAWETHYADTAKVYHNTWDDAKAQSAAETRAGLTDILSNVTSYTFNNDSIYVEMIIDTNGEHWVNFWGNWNGTLKANGQELEVPVHLSLRMVDNKIVEEYAFYNLAEFNAALDAIEAAKMEEEAEASEN